MENRLALPEPVYDMDYIRTANRVRGLHFFDADTMRFFNSRVLSTVYAGSGGVYFVTSERFNYASPRLYTVRSFDPATGCTATVGDFQMYGTARAARERAAKLAAGSAE